MTRQTTLPVWLRDRPYGALTALRKETGLAWTTVCRAARGENVRLRSAILISRATDGQVPVDALTDELAELAALGENAPRRKRAARMRSAA